MPQSHLTSLRIAHALQESFKKSRYSKSHFRADLLAGITVGVIAIPLSMALAIASGVAPQYGLYTAMVGGFVAALSGGSRFSVSGPTAAFVVILLPITQQYGLAGLCVATMMAGVLMLCMAWARLGRAIQFIPQAVTLGFTGGIAIVIATLQLKDFFGLTLATKPQSWFETLSATFSAAASVKGHAVASPSAPIRHSCVAHLYCTHGVGRYGGGDYGWRGARLASVHPRAGQDEQSF